MVDLNVKNHRVLFISSLALSIATILTFFLAMIAVPISGANAPGGGIPYPYTNIFGQYPKDFIWQMVAVVQIIIFTIWVKVICSVANERRSLLCSIASAFGVMASIILIANYYLQISVVPISLKSNEMEGIPLLIQYNPHGVFIALEELGYWLMLGALTLISFLCGKVIKLVAIIIDIVVVIGFTAICLAFGIDRKDRFEILILSLDWIIMIYLGIVFAVKAKRAGNVRNFEKEGT